MLVLLFAAAHQGEEFVLILPAIMLVGAFLIMRWANQPDPDAPSKDSSDDDEQLFEEPEAVKSTNDVAG